MTEKRTPSQATLAKNVFGEIQKLKRAIAHAKGMRDKKLAEYDDRIENLKGLLLSAEAELERLTQH